VNLFEGDCLSLLSQVADSYPDGIFDAIFADPPYFLSNGGITCQNGRMVSVDKGAWDRSKGPDIDHEFNRTWLAACQMALTPNGTIWVSGTSHVIHSVGFAMQQLGMKILNNITWEKPNPPPNLSCRYFTHATETILWAARSTKSKHTFNYDVMRRQNGGKQMKSVWRLRPPDASEKALGKHPTQKPVALLTRIITASTQPGALVFDPFMGSGTTGVAALLAGRRFVGIESDAEHFGLAQARVAAAYEAAHSNLFAAQDSA
jgi:site-specific DNA-methyltransferase (adenine-specific)